jgi:hypothetical protein
MSASAAFITRIPADWLDGLAAVVDRGLRLKTGAVRNAAQAMSTDFLHARARAEATAALSAAATPWHEVSLRGA